MLLEYNIAPNTQIGFIDIPNQVYQNENAYNNDKYVRGGEYIENLVTDNTIEFCHRWLHLANFKEFLEDWKEYLNKNNANFSNYCDGSGKGYHDGRMITCPVYYIGNGRIAIKPIYKTDKNKKRNPIINMKTFKDSGVNLNDFNE